MAKPKETIAYLSFSVGYLSDRKIIRIRRDMEKISNEASLSPLVILAIEFYIAQTNGYYANFNDSFLEEIAFDVKCDQEFVMQTIESAVQVGYFDGSLFAQKILSSEEIQRNYIRVMESTKRFRQWPSLPYMLVCDSDDGQERRQSKRCASAYNAVNNSSEKCVDSSEKCVDSSEKCVDSSEKCVDSSGECYRRGIGNSSGKSKRKVGVKDCSENSPHSFCEKVFDFGPLQEKWEDLMKQEKWRHSSPERIKLAQDRIRPFSDYEAMAIIDYTILGNYDNLYTDNHDRIKADAERIRWDYERTKGLRIVKENPAKTVYPIEFSYFTNGKTDSTLPPEASALRNKWAKLQFPDDIRSLSCEKTTFHLEENSATIFTAGEVVDWLNMNRKAFSEAFSDCRLNINYEKFGS